jgi:D-inositol-3-phosphate glycosyltransferase
LRGGIANFNESLALELQKAGHIVEIISFYYQYPSLLFPGKSQYDTTEKAPQGITIKSLISSINPLSWSKTASYIQSTQPDFSYHTILDAFYGTFV